MRNEQANIESDTIQVSAIINTLWNRKKILVGIVVLGLILGGIYRALTPRVYQANILVESDLLTYIEAQQVIKNAKLRALEKKFLNGLPDSIKPEDLDVFKKQVKDISFSAVKKEQGIFEIDLHVYDKQIFHDLKNIVLHSMNKNPYVEEKLLSKREELMLLKSQIEEELQTMEGLKEELANAFQQERTTGNILYSPFKMHTELIDLKERKLTIQRQLDNLSGFNIIDQLVISQTPVNLTITRILLLSGIVALFLGVFLVFLIEVGKNNLYKE